MTNTKLFLKKSILLPISLVLTTAVLPACSWVTVHKIDIPQGTPISTDKLSQVQIGMNHNQVLYILGSPAVRDTLNPNRWDYIYDFTAGKIAKREGKTDIHNAEQYVKIYFDNAGKVIKIEK